MELVYIQILRFVAAASVVIFHSLAQGQLIFPDRSAPVFGLFVNGGYGVDFFFVISGFIIFYSTYRSNPHWRQFLRRRMERIAPLYWILTLTLFGLGAAVPQLFKSTDWISVSHLIHSLTYTSFTTGQMPLLYVGWSLEYEMFFYLAVTLAIMSAKNHAWELVAGLLCLGIDLGLVFSIDTSSPVLYFFTNPIILEFVLGAFVAMLLFSGRASWPVAISIGVTFAILFVRDPMNRAVIVGIPATLTVLGAAYLSRASKPWLNESLPARLGDASYSIYLVQIFTISLVIKYLVKLLPNIPLDALVFATAVATLAGGRACFLLVERPLLNLCRGRPLFFKLAAS